MPIITVSRPYGSGGTLFGKTLAEKMGYPYIDKSFCSVLSDEAKHYLHFESEEEEAAPLLIQRIAELMSNRNFYKANLMTTIYSMALKGNIIFCGRGANIILEGVPDVLSILTVGKLSDRVKGIAEVKGLSYDDALKLIERADNEKRKFVEYYFDKDLFDLSLYHLVINMSLMPIDNSEEMVFNYVNKYFTEAGRVESQKILRKRLMEKRAEILIFGLNMSKSVKLSFEAKDDGVLAVKGIVSGEGEKKRLLTALEAVEGVQKVEDNLKTGILSRMIY
jgi:cytidylate kinase